MKNFMIILGLTLSACGNTQTPFAIQDYRYTPQYPVINPPQNFPLYYCYYNGMIVQRRVFHPAFRPTWIYAPYANCL